MDNEQIFHLTEDLADDFTWMFAINEVANRNPNYKAGPWDREGMPRWMDSNHRFNYPFTPSMIWAMYNNLEQFIGVMVELDNESVVLAQYDRQANVLKWLSTDHMDDIAEGCSAGRDMYRNPLNLYNANVHLAEVRKNGPYTLKDARNNVPYPSKIKMEEVCYTYQEFSRKDIVKDLIIDFNYLDTNFSYNFKKVWGELSCQIINEIHHVSGTRSQILAAGHKWFDIIESECYRYIDMRATGDGIIDSVTALGHLVAISIQLPTDEFMVRYRELWHSLPGGWRDSAGIPHCDMAFHVQSILI